MLTVDQIAFLDALQRATGITDVYIHKDVVYVINAYDEEEVAVFMNGQDYIGLEYELVIDEDTMVAYG